jgi:hypothetical protein
VFLVQPHLYLALDMNQPGIFGREILGTVEAVEGDSFYRQRIGSNGAFPRLPAYVSSLHQLDAAAFAHQLRYLSPSESPF